MWRLRVLPLTRGMQGGLQTLTSAVSASVKSTSSPLIPSLPRASFCTQRLPFDPRLMSLLDHQYSRLTLRARYLAKEQRASLPLYFTSTPRASQRALHFFFFFCNLTFLGRTKKRKLLVPFCVSPLAFFFSFPTAPLFFMSRSLILTRALARELCSPQRTTAPFIKLKLKPRSPTSSRCEREREAFDAPRLHIRCLLLLPPN